MSNIQPSEKVARPEPPKSWGCQIIRRVLLQLIFHIFYYTISIKYLIGSYDYIDFSYLSFPLISVKCRQEEKCINGH